VGMSWVGLGSLVRFGQKGRVIEHGEKY
jgi:hypothetical protein